TRRQAEPCRTYRRNERSPVGTHIINLARPRQPYFNRLASPSDYVVLVDVPGGPNQALFDKPQFVVKPINTDSEVCATTLVFDRGAAPLHHRSNSENLLLRNQHQASSQQVSADSEIA